MSTSSDDNGERKLWRINKRNLLYCLPIIVIFIVTLVLEMPFLSTYKESHRAIQLNFENIHPELVFKKALERVNVTALSSPFPFPLHRDNTGLELTYEINQNGHLLHSKSPKSNKESLYEDFPRQLIYSASPTILGAIPLEGPEDIDLPIIPEERIMGLFEGTLRQQNEDRETELGLALWMNAIILVICIISTLTGAPLMMVLAIPWLMKWAELGMNLDEFRRTSMADYSFTSDMIENYEKYGVSVDFIQLKSAGGFHETTASIFYFMGFLLSWILGRFYIEYECN